MLATFSLRLACGLASALLLLPSRVVNPRFYRVQFLTVLGLIALAAVSLGMSMSAGMSAALVVTALAAFAGSVLWSLEEAPGRIALIVVTALASVAALSVHRIAADREPTEAEQVSAAAGMPLQLADELSSAGLLGAAMTAMLMGHAYLIAPAMSLTPLLRLLAALLGATLLRMTLAGVGVWSWSDAHAWSLDDETVLWLPLRWGIGFVAPLILGAMAWQTTRIRSTQSATGILYVVVVFCFLGELTSQLLLRNTGLVL